MLYCFYHDLMEAGMGSNYEKMADGARALFLTMDQAAMIARWDLPYDDDWLYVTYMGEDMRIRRRTGEIESLAPAGDYRSPDNVNETMAIFDLLTHSDTRPRAAGRWASVSSLGGIIGAGHDRTLSHEGTAAIFAGQPERLAAACRRVGGAPLGRADVGYVVPVFHDFGIWFQFWDGDDEFPANIKYLFDENALQFMHYETLWYVMNSLAARLEFYFTP